ncbi:MAG: TetR/AcrR family transcriptional regulator, partial [Haliea sp.]
MDKTTSRTQAAASTTAAPLTRADTAAERGALAAREIFEHAMTLFEKQGFHRTSMNEIADACGVTKPTLYYYFRNKSHLLETLYEEITKNFFGQVRTLSASSLPAPQRLRQLIEMQVTYNISSSRFLTIFWRERHELDDAARTQLAQIERDFEQMVQGIVDDGLADGSFRPCDGKVVTYSVLSLLSTVHRWSKYVGKQPGE